MDKPWKDGPKKEGFRKDKPFAKDGPRGDKAFGDKPFREKEAFQGWRQAVR